MPGPGRVDFLETIQGDLVNLASGDHLRWSTSRGQKCIEFRLAGTMPLTAVRNVTLEKYLSVQNGMVKLLAAA